MDLLDFDAHYYKVAAQGRRQAVTEKLVNADCYNLCVIVMGGRGRDFKAGQQVGGP